MASSNPLTAYHGLIDCDNISEELCMDNALIEKVLCDTAHYIGAKIINVCSEPLGIEKSKSSLSRPGCSVVVQLDESHITAHTYANERKMAVDIFFSFDEKKCKSAIEHIIKAFDLVDFKSKIIPRF
jgi:S-adenosylmethionine decarboxylase